MKPADRHEWILNYLRGEYPRAHVDVCNSDFVAAYIEATNAPHYLQMFGAHKCPQLGRDLATMTKAYSLKRSRTGLGGMAGMGFPTWVWCYRLAIDERCM